MSSSTLDSLENLVRIGQLEKEPPGENEVDEALIEALIRVVRTLEERVEAQQLP